MDLERKYKIFEEQSEVIPKALYCYPFCFYSTKAVCIIMYGAVQKSCQIRYLLTLLCSLAVLRHVFAAVVLKIKPKRFSSAKTPFHNTRHSASITWLHGAMTGRKTQTETCQSRGENDAFSREKGKPSATHVHI